MIMINVMLQQVHTGTYQYFEVSLCSFLRDVPEFFPVFIYSGEPTKVRMPHDFVSMTDKKAKQRARARHETVNKRLKQWGCLKQTFRHKRNKHKLVFAAVAVCTQLIFESGESPFQDKSVVRRSSAHTFMRPCGSHRAQCDLFVDPPW